MTPACFGSKSMNLLVFSILSQKSVPRSRLNGVCIGRCRTSAHVIYALFSHFCYVGGFGNLGDPMLPTLRGVSGDVVTAYIDKDTKGRFLQSVARRGPVKTHAKDTKCVFPPIMAYKSEWAVHNLLIEFFTLGSSKIEVFETYFFDTVIT